ncbi:hypothetical protein PsorP6_017133 [Peronosclerospora sorghi]|uniref:Uncharacterized protein n=1 Tax=Peronosclerospora sorghi TaxID=230839 RepID=A0ACC0WG62_9STRA|nr:hypothetical protein PsorP6_017133 [Peronosclerospora sorghi]
MTLSMISLLDFSLTLFKAGDEIIPMSYVCQMLFFFFPTSFIFRFTMPLDYQFWLAMKLSFV